MAEFEEIDALENGLSVTIRAVRPADKAAIVEAFGKLDAESLPTEWTVADLMRHVGDVPLERIRLYPPPGMATEDDAFRIRDREECCANWSHVEVFLRVLCASVFHDLFDELKHRGTEDHGETN